MNARSRQTICLGLLLVASVAGCTRATLPPPAPAPAPSAARADEPRAAEARKLDHALLHFQKGATLLESGKFNEAKTVFEGLRTTYPHVSVFHNNLGVVYKRLGLLNEAIASYRQAITIHPGYSEAYYNLAIALREQGRFREAEEAYRRAIDSAPDFRDAHYNLAVLYDLYLNEPEKAIEHYETYLVSGGEGREEVTIWIAALQKRAGRPQEAP